MRSLMLILLVFVALATKGQSVNIATDTTIYKENELTIKPEFAGGKDKWNRFLGHTFRYPADSRVKNIQGQVFIAFTVEKDGTLTNYQITKGLADDLNQETLRVLKLSPKWKPGQINGSAVRSRIEVPVGYYLAN